ncbi:MAG: hypothetical protein O3A39_04055 [Proteobacteria bacterium]|nr:hypothetical protein [Pseudomonadota bacterium]
MELGQYDTTKAKNEAKMFLAKSIDALSSLLNVDYTSLDENSKNPFSETTPQYQAFNCLIEEIISYRKLT